MAQDDWLGIESTGGDDWLGLDVAPEPTPEPVADTGRSAGELAGDFGRSLLSGAIAVPKQIVGLADLAATPARLGYDAVTGGKSGTLTEGLAGAGVDFNRAQGILRDSKSDPGKQQREYIDEQFSENGALAGLGAIWDNPSVAFETVAESAPGMLALAGATRVFALRIYAEAQGGAIASGATAEAAAQAGSAAVRQALPKLGAISSSLEGGQVAGDMASGYAAEGELDGKRAGATLGAGLTTAAIGRTINSLGARLGFDDVEAIVASGGLRDSVGTIFKGGAKGAAREGIEESLQSGSENEWANFADGRAFGEGTPQAMIEGGIAGGIMGAGGGTVSARGSAPAPEDIDGELQRMRRRDIDAEAQAAAEATLATGGDVLDAELARQGIYQRNESYDVTMPGGSQGPFNADQFNPIPTGAPEGTVNFNPWQQGMEQPIQADSVTVDGQSVPMQTLDSRMDDSLPYAPPAAPGGLELQPMGEAPKAGNEIEFQPRDVTSEKAAPIEALVEEQGYRDVGLYAERGETERPGEQDPAIPARQEIEDEALADMTRAYDELVSSMPKKPKGNQKRSNDDMEILTAIASSGGLSRTQAEAEGIDPAEFGRQAGGIAYVFHKNGKTFDEMAELLNDSGFFGSEPYSGSVLADMILESMRGRPVFSPTGGVINERMAIESALGSLDTDIQMFGDSMLDDADNPPKGAAWQAADDNMRALGYAILEADLLGVDADVTSGIINEAATDAEAVTKLQKEIALEKEFREWLKPVRQGEGRSPGREAAPRSQEPQEEVAEQAAEQAAPELELAQETEQGRADRERAQGEATARESAAATETEQRVQADAEVGDLSLTGSDLAADANPNQVDLLDTAANEAATSPTNDLPEPSQAQKDAGNYKVGKVKIQGMDVSIENPKGSTRSGKRPDGSTWTNTMGSHYGYIKRTEGADGDHVDTYIGPNPEAGSVYVVDQVNPDGSFDEHKVMTGYDSQDQAEKAYLENYDKGWTLGPVTEMPVEQFKEWLASGDTKSPLAPKASVNRIADAKKARDAKVAVEKLKSVTITESFQDETGEVVTVEQQADVALRQIDKRLGTLDKLLGCLK